MMSDQEFINIVWNKYDDFIKTKNRDKFFVQDQIRKLKRLRVASAVASFLLTLIITGGMVYAGIKTYEYANSYIQKNMETKFEENVGYDYSQNMVFNNSMYYKKIYNYQEYIEAKKIWKELLEMKPEDFESSFLIVITGENYNTTGLYISKVYDKNGELNIELKKKDIWNEKDTAVAAKIPKELDEEKVNIMNLPNEVNVSNNYIDIKKITKNYTIEDAIKDNCFVVSENDDILSKDKNRLDEFVKNCNNNIEDNIRIYVDDIDRILIYDIEYKNKKINMINREIGLTSDIDETYYRTGNKILTSDEEDSTRYYELYDEIGNGIIFCIVKI